MNLWTELMSREQLAERYAATAKIDAGFAATDRKFYETRSSAELRDLRAQAWNLSNAEMYCVARSYLALRAGG